MPTPTPQTENPDVAYVQWTGTLLGVPYSNGIHVAGPNVLGVMTPLSEASLNSTLDKVQNWLTETLMPLMALDLVITKLSARQEVSSGGIYVERAVNIAGAQVGDALPGSVALPISIKGAVTGRAGSGRCYQGGFVEAHCSGNLINSVIAIDVATAWQELYGALANFAPAFSHPMGVYSTQLNGAKRLVGLFTPAVSVNIRTNRVGSQRRRNGRRRGA